jgi:hypothetical protein
MNPSTTILEVVSCAHNKPLIKLNQIKESRSISQKGYIYRERKSFSQSKDNCSRSPPPKIGSEGIMLKSSINIYKHMVTILTKQS